MRRDPKLALPRDGHLKVVHTPGSLALKGRREEDLTVGRRPERRTGPAETEQSKRLVIVGPQLAIHRGHEVQEILDRTPRRAVDRLRRQSRMEDLRREGGQRSAAHGVFQSRHAGAAGQVEPERASEPLFQRVSSATLGPATERRSRSTYSSRTPQRRTDHVPQEILGIAVDRADGAQRHLCRGRDADEEIRKCAEVRSSQRMWPFLLRGRRASA